MDAKELNPKLVTKLRELSEKPDGWGDIRLIEPADARAILAALPSDAAQAPLTADQRCAIDTAINLIRTSAPTYGETVRNLQSLLADAPQAPQKSVATVRVTHSGYGMELSTHVAYALPEGMHDLYAAPVAPAAAAPDTADTVFRRCLDLEIQNLTVNGNNEITWMAISCRGVVSSLSTDKEAARASAAAVRTLEAKGYTYLDGAEMWKPPLGQPPAWVAHDTQAARDVLAERVRQVIVEGWTPTHDDQHADGDLALAASVYAASAGGVSWPDSDPYLWPWAREWWKPTTPRRDLVKAAALIIAEIERIDRAESGNESADAQDGAQ